MTDKIKALCRAKGISITELEKELGFGYGSIYRWEKSSPSIDKVKAVTDYFGITVNDLLDYSDETDPEALLLMNAMANRPELKVLFRASNKIKKEDVEAILRLLRINDNQN